MSTRARVFVLALLALAGLSVTGDDLRAQQQPRTSSLMLPIAGTADLGGTFTGTLLIQDFAAQGSAIFATGSVSGTLSDASGTTRNLVTQVALPLDTDASVSRQNTDFAIARASCELLHLELGSVAVNVLGSTIAFEPIALDITTAAQVTGPAQPANTASQPSPTVTGTGISATARAGGTGATQSGSTTFGTTTAARGTTATTAPRGTQQTQTQLGSLLCAAANLQNVGNRTQFAQMLNQILDVLG